MKKMICLLATLFTCMLLVGSCGNDPGPDPGISVKQVDMTVSVPIHPSSLEYFDYVFQYSDNTGNMTTEIIQTDESSPCYIRTFSYTRIPVSCMATVEMVPKEGCTSVGAFLFYIPKPYIYPNVYESAAPIGSGTPDQDMDGTGLIPIDPMTVEEFQALYGTSFTTVCSVKSGTDGYDINVN